MKCCFLQLLMKLVVLLDSLTGYCAGMLDSSVSASAAADSAYTVEIQHYMQAASVASGAPY